jgi:septum site-determining protein MinC
MPAQIEVKGLRDGILITLGEGTWAELFPVLIDHLDKQAGFLRGARIALDVGNLVFKAAELGQLRNDISERGMTLWAILGASPTTETTAQTLGLATRLSKPRPDLTVPRIETTLQNGEEAILVQRTLRSGFSLQHKGHVVVIGDVNPGAEIIASGNIIVWGKVRGKVHAGADGDHNAVICALDLLPSQLRIAGSIVIANEKKKQTQPEMVRLMNGQVKIEKWEPKKSKG